MSELKKELFSMFNNFRTGMTLAEKKKIKSTLKDFLDCICELHNIDKDIIMKNVEVSKRTSDFLIQLGVIDNVDEINDLKALLSKDYKNFISIINIYLSLEIVIDDTLKKFMDYYRKEEVRKYLDDNQKPTLVDFSVEQVV